MLSKSKISTTLNTMPLSKAAKLRSIGMLMQILFSKDNVEDVLRISDRLQVIPVKDACAVWLEKEMNAFNVLEILLL